jgi:maltooligosyltrehalose trehalohydrolase
MNNLAIAKRSVGLNFGHKGTAILLIWAPHAENAAVRLENGEDIVLDKQEQGYWQITTGRITPGSCYQIVLDGNAWPDITALLQPDVHGLSVAFDLNEFAWSDQQWRNKPLEEYIIYELHTGTFTDTGTFASVVEKLDHLVMLGITAVEIMPVAQFPGDRNWGYDGVFPFAVQESYGGPHGLQHLVDACHQKGLAVILDVVYNHIGPEGNYLEKYGPFFTDKYKTPWGNAVNFDDAGCDGVRRYFIENALMWLRDFHIDALRMDAVHAIKDFGPKHILREIKEYTAELDKATGKRHYLIVECDLNDPRFIDPVARSGFGMDAQWTDEFHHALRVAAGGSRDGYYSDFNGLGDLVDAFNHAYVYNGRYSALRDKSFGADPAKNSGEQFVVFSQNHDQVGNRMLGERSSQLFSFEMQKLMVAAVMVSPFLPMLFMGEEYGEESPFLYFVSHTDSKLIEGVRKGRREEFEAFHAEGEAPDPQAEDTYIRSRLNWDLLSREPHQLLLTYYKALILLRKRHPALLSPDRKSCQAAIHDFSGIVAVYRSHESHVLACLLNFSAEKKTIRLPDFSDAPVIFNSGQAKWHGPAASPGTGSGQEYFTVQPESILIIEKYV